MTDVRRWIVPGRVNLIGEHLDYNGGPVLPMAIDRHVVVKARARDDDQVNVWSDSRRATFSTSVAEGEVDGWAALSAGVVWALGRDGHRVPGADLVIESDLPSGAGLSSSAAVACGVALALDDLGRLGLDRTAIAAVARRSENDYLGVPSGVMDQLAVMHDAASLIDTRSGEVREVAVGWADAGLSLVVVDTGVQHAIAGGDYTDRHDECRRATEALGLDHLADVSLDDLFRLDPGPDGDLLKSRARHVLTETARVRSAVRALEAADWAQLGTLLTASHASLRDDFAVSCPELDTVVDTALEAGALGARLTGFGFGGSVIALAPNEALLGMRDTIGAAFSARDWKAPTLFTVRPSPGARRQDDDPA